MAAAVDHKELYRTSVFDEWAHRHGLYPFEKELIERFLERRCATLEAGTGGGRIARGMLRLGYGPLTGCDFVPEMIEQARRHDATRSIRFDVGDARTLPYACDAFDQVVYLQQMMSFIPEAQGREDAARESFRVLKPGGVALFSFLAYETKEQGLIMRGYLKWIALLRWLRGETLSLQYLPWMKMKGRPHPGCLWDARPYNYWYRAHEAAALLTGAGYEIVDEQHRDGCHYYVCRKSVRA